MVERRAGSAATGDAPEKMSNLPGRHQQRTSRPRPAREGPAAGLADGPLANELDCSCRPTLAVLRDGHREDVYVLHRGMCSRSCPAAAGRAAS